jgi:hypothetical protein
MEFQLPILIGLLIEAIVYYTEQLAVKRNFDWRLIAALVAGIAGAVVFEQDVYAAAGLNAVVPFLGSVFTGILFSRVANATHDVIQKVRSKTVAVVAASPAQIEAAME